MLTYLFDSNLKVYILVSYAIVILLFGISSLVIWLLHLLVGNTHDIELKVKPYIIFTLVVFAPITIWPISIGLVISVVKYNKEK